MLWKPRKGIRNNQSKLCKIEIGIFDRIHEYVFKGNSTNIAQVQILPNKGNRPSESPLITETQSQETK